MRTCLCPLGRPFALRVSYQNACSLGVAELQLARTSSVASRYPSEHRLRGASRAQQGEGGGGVLIRDVRSRCTAYEQPPLTQVPTGGERSQRQARRGQP